MRLLVIDTCLGACQAVLVEDRRIVVGRSEAMERGHQERLAPLVRDAMGEAGWRFADLNKLAITIGPGSFTGLRVGLAFAKGLAFATGAPLAGIGTLEALAASVGAGLAAGVIDARRGLAYLQPFRDGRALAEPDIVALDVAAARLRALSDDGWRLVGPGAALLGAAIAAEFTSIPAPAIEALARLGCEAAPQADVRPLYLRAPDARPMSER